MCTQLPTTEHGGLGVPVGSEDRPRGSITHLATACTRAHARTSWAASPHPPCSLLLDCVRWGPQLVQRSEGLTKARHADLCGHMPALRRHLQPWLDATAALMWFLGSYTPTEYCGQAAGTQMLAWPCARWHMVHGCNCTCVGDCLLLLCPALMCPRSYTR